MSDYTPTDGEVELAYAERAQRVLGIGHFEAVKEFGLWLNQVKADAWDEGFDTGATHGIAYQAGSNDSLPRQPGLNPYREAQSKITDEMVETAAQALHHIDGTGTHPQWDLEWDYVKADYLLQAAAALEAVAPLIAAQTLRHEADNAPGARDVPAGVWHLDRTSRNYLRARAEQIEGGTTGLEASLEWLESVAREREAGQ